MVHPGRAILNRDPMIDGLPPTSPPAPLPRSGFVLRPLLNLHPSRSVNVLNTLS